ncbi:MAG: hypothetical protein IJO27_00410 [Bacilli bacterium]|nr:hypothetical protein [Bacilli bacterium]
MNECCGKCYGCINFAQYNDGKFSWDYCKLKGIYTDINVASKECIQKNKPFKRLSGSINQTVKKFNDLVQSTKDFAEVLENEN